MSHVWIERKCEGGVRGAIHVSGVGGGCHVCVSVVLEVC